MIYLVGDYVLVTAKDYKYTGWLVSKFVKRSGAERVIVEDLNGRLLVHNKDQISYQDAPKT